MSNFNLIQQKILNRQDLQQALEIWNNSKSKIVFTNGCFDLVHRGHIDYLSKAADLGDILIIGLNTDKSVSRLKGINRPIIDQQSRALLLASFFFVSAVVMFDEDTPYQLIKEIQPDVLIKGADYTVEEIVGHDIVLAKGGNVITLDFLPGFSTSAIEKKIKE
jgi:D-glycero-beta-D-manno-heptose 1-phosphate adenylyltransferase